MRGASGYWLRIFVSSTDFDLRDARAELCDFLGKLGYQAILSSEAGFPDLTPRMAPWESCLEVLRTCPLMVLVIDSRYGTPLKWPSFFDVVGKEDLAPTHAEYRFARHKHLRMLVYVRSSLLTHYEAFRNAWRVWSEDGHAPTDSELESVLSLPRHVDIGALRFLSEVKTTQPIPWIQGFHDIVELKTDLQQRLTNELAEVVMSKQGHLEFALTQVSKALDELPPPRRAEYLRTIGVAREIIDAGADALAKAKEDLEASKDALEAAKKETTEARAAAEQDSANTRERLRNAEHRATDLDAELKRAQHRLQAVSSATAQSVVSSSFGKPTLSTGVPTGTYNWGTASPVVASDVQASGTGIMGPAGSTIERLRCAKCGKETLRTGLGAAPFRRRRNRTKSLRFVDFVPT